MEHKTCIELPAVWRRIQSNFCKFFLNSVNIIKVDISKLTENWIKSFKSTDGKSK
jgi:hypothetical protein